MRTVMEVVVEVEGVQDVVVVQGMRTVVEGMSAVVESMRVLAMLDGVRIVMEVVVEGVLAVVQCVLDSIQ